MLDNPQIPFEDIKRNMQELNIVNTLLGGHRITIKGFKKLLGDKKEIVVCEIGCGGGDNLFAIEKWCKKNNIKAELTGIDINPNCIAFAKKQYPQFHFICSDYKDLSFEKRNDPDDTESLVHRPDIIFNSLFCHHFSTEEVAEILSWMHKNAATGFFINDLHRHPIAHYSIKILTKLFSNSYLVKHDAPLSVLRGFTKKEWQDILQKSDIKNAVLSWEWAFRHLIVASS